MLELAPFRMLRDETPAMMTAHIVYPQIDPRYPATLSRAILGGLLRDEWRYDGVVITDSLVMKAIHDRYGHDRAAVLALQAGADMVMALGILDEQAAAIDAIQGGLERGELDRLLLLRARGRLNALAGRFPVDPDGYSAEARRADDELMRRAWARGLTAFGGAKAPPLDQPLRIVAQRDVPGDGISEPGLSGDQVAALFKRFETVDVMQVDELCALDWSTVARDRRTTVLASNARARYGKNARAWRPDLHLVLWNPFQALDVAAPTIVTWGYANGALDALQAWLEGRGDAPGRAPVPIAPP
jgi:beta-N-acetylhexosaminidase